MVYKYVFLDLKEAESSMTFLHTAARHTKPGQHLINAMLGDYFRALFFSIRILSMMVPGPECTDKDQATQAKLTSLGTQLGHVHVGRVEK